MRPFAGAQIFVPQVGLVSGPLQYFEDPFATLKLRLSSGIDTLNLDRTPFHSVDHKRLMLHHVPPRIYPGCYPAWIFSKPEFSSLLLEQGRTSRILTLLMDFYFECWPNHRARGDDRGSSKPGMVAKDALVN